MNSGINVECNRYNTCNTWEAFKGLMHSVYPSENKNDNEEMTTIVIPPPETMPTNPETKL